jgi:hypothetical protein
MEAIMLRRLPWIICLLFTFRAEAQPPLFRMVPLPELNGFESQALGIGSDAADKIQIAGWSRTPMGVERAVHWGETAPDSFALTPLPVPDPTRPSRACAYTYDERDLLVGHATTETGLPKPVLWQKEAPGPWTMTPLPTLAGGTGEGADITGVPNPPGDFGIVGWSNTLEQIPKACFWRADDLGVPQVTPLPHPTQGSAGNALGIGAHDAETLFVAGWATSATGDTIAQVWSSINGGDSWSRAELPQPKSSSWSLGSDAGCGNNRVTIVGSARGAQGEYALRWESLDFGMSWTIQDMEMLEGSLQSGAASVNFDEVPMPMPDGIVVGRSYNTTPLADGIATLWDPSIEPDRAYAIDELVEGTPPLSGFAYDGLDRLTSGAPVIAGTGRPLIPPGALDSVSAEPHAFVLIGDPEASGVDIPATPASFLTLHPNPVLRTTMISLSLLQAGTVRLTVHDVTGKRVATLIDGWRDAGVQTVHWDGRDSNGRPVASAIYIMNLVSNQTTQRGKVVVLR